jgi:hypothetical protein
LAGNKKDDKVKISDDMIDSMLVTALGFKNLRL